MKTIKLAMFCSLMMLFAGGMVGSAAAQTVAGSLGCPAFCVDLYEVTCSGSLQLIVGVASDPELVVSGSRTIPAPTLTGPEVATMQLMRPGGDGEAVILGLPRKGTIKALVTLMSPQAAAPDYELKLTCFTGVDGNQLKPGVIKLKQDQ